MEEYTGILNTNMLEIVDALAVDFSAFPTYPATTILGPGGQAPWYRMTIKASPADMEAKAADVSTQASKMRQIFEELTRVMERTSGYWNGEAAELHRKRYQDMRPEIERMFQCLEEHAENLREIAATYTETQARLTSMAQALPKDAIE